MRSELKLFATFPKEMEQFRGKHVAMIGRKVVASRGFSQRVFRKGEEAISRQNAGFSIHSKKRSVGALGVSLWKN